MTKTARASRTTPGLKRLRAAPNAEAIRESTVADQKRARRTARARIEAAQTPADALSPVPAPVAPATAATAATARPARARKAFEATPVPTPAERMEGMSRATAALYLEAAKGVMPTAPDFSKPSYAEDRRRLAELVALANAGDVAGLRAYGIRVFYSGAQALDRYRHRAILAIEARARQTAA